MVLVLDGSYTQYPKSVNASLELYKIELRKSYISLYIGWDPSPAYHCSSKRDDCLKIDNQNKIPGGNPSVT
jgi:hypothetical protein